MANRKEYAYQIRANQLSLVEKDFTNLDDGLNYTYTEGAGIDIPSGGTLFKSPLEAVSGGLEIEYVYSPVENIVDEKNIIDLPKYLNLALVYYVKARLAEDGMNIEAKEYFMREFNRMIEKHENAKVAGPRRIMPGSHAIR